MSDDKSPGLARLPALPTELLLAILEDLQAYDLIALSRTNHRLHAVVSLSTRPLAQRLQTAHCARLSTSAASFSLSNLSISEALIRFATVPQSNGTSTMLHAADGTPRVTTPLSFVQWYGHCNTLPPITWIKVEAVANLLLRYNNLCKSFLQPGWRDIAIQGVKNAPSSSRAMIPGTTRTRRRQVEEALKMFRGETFPVTAAAQNRCGAVEFGFRAVPCDIVEHLLGLPELISGGLLFSDAAVEPVGPVRHGLCTESRLRGPSRYWTGWGKIEASASRGGTRRWRGWHLVDARGIVGGCRDLLD